MQRFKTQILLLHSEQSTLDRFSASLGDAYSVHLATSGTEALNTLGLTPIHVMVSAQRLPGMSGIEALREARKRSPEILGILIAPKDMSGAEAEALVGSEALFQVIRGVGTPEQMRRVIDDAVDQLRLNTLQESANDRSAGPAPRIAKTTRPGNADPPHRGGAAHSSGAYPAVAAAAATELVVLSKDEVFLDTIRQALSPRQPVHAVDDLRAAAKIVGDASSAVLVTDAAVAPRDVEAITARLRSRQPRLVTIVAGRRDDGDQLMDLINSGMVYRFLLKPISPGRARLAIEAAIRRAREQAKPTAPGAPGAPTGPGGPTLADFEGAEEVVLSEEEPMPRTPLRPQPRQPAAGEPGSRRQSPGTREPKPESAKATRAAKAARAKATKAPPLQDDLSVQGLGGGRSRPARLAAGGALLAVVAAAAVWWTAGGPETDTMPTPAGTAADAPPPASAREETPAPPPVSPDLQRARGAVAAGRLLAPGENGALARYADALARAPGDADLAAEAEDVVAQAVSAVAAALDGGRPGEARAGLSVIRASFPSAPGLPEIDRRLALAERDRLLARADELAAAGDPEGAMALLDEAGELLPGRSPAVAARRESLLAASDGRGRTLLLELGNQRLLQGQLVEPAADNARYYYRAVLAQDSDSIAGRQGMAFLQTALVTRIREAIEAGDRADAERWLEEARVSGVEESRLASFREAAGRLSPTPPTPVSQPEPAPRPRSDTVTEPGAAAETDVEEPASAGGETAEPDPATGPADETAPVSPVSEETSQSAPVDEPADQSDTAPVTPAPAALPSEETAAESEEPAVVPAEPDSEPAGRMSSDASDDAVAAGQAQQAPAAASDPVDSATAANPEEPATVDAPPPVRPERITYVPPTYPRAAEIRGLEGWVDVDFSLTPAGLPADIRVTESSPPRTFDQAAIDAVDQWRYDPMAAADWPTGERIRVRINFGIDP